MAMQPVCLLFLSPSPGMHSASIPLLILQISLIRMSHAWDERQAVRHTGFAWKKVNSSASQCQA